MLGVVYDEQFGFLFNKQIHDVVVGIAQEGLHSLKTQKWSTSIIEIDLAKAFYRVNWMFIRSLLLQMGMDLHNVKWIMGCLTSFYFEVLINGSPFGLFTSSKGLRHSYPLSPFIFLLVFEGLSMLINDAISKGYLKGLRVSNSSSILHLLFVDDAMLFFHVYVK